jgi:DNA-binding transcriptional regulator YbjK
MRSGGSELYEILKGTVAETEEAGKKVANFDHALTAHAARLLGTNELTDVRGTVAELHDDTGQMRVVTVALAGQLKARTDEVALLRQRLELARSEAMLDVLTGLNNRRGFEEAARTLAQSPTA